ncbi:glutathione S-transferase family protein [Parahaliea mediterranea]|uniref:Glutathione S-transferase family protein n=1 Tax=Parahaliea mediterranea TaxID=651086 RepID=A0A939DDC9_9GAMM|nr:glutathione S-transferase family protein [Parahaliea mediterranea]MBN7796175.1 glutathione S-transferase family protein [Parahaliea mediterranea]
MFELYHAPFSTCSQKVRLCLAEKGIDYVSHLVDLSRQEHLLPQYLELNPNGVVPTLVHGASVIVDSSVICEYLDEVVPEPRLSPATAAGRAGMRSWMRYFEEVPTAAIRVPSFNGLFAKAFARMPDDQFEAMTESMPLRRSFYRKMRETEEGFDQATFDESIESLARTLERVDASLDPGPWILGEQFTVADIVLVPTIVRMDDIGLAHMWANYPRVSGWYRRVQERRSFDIAYFDGSRVSLPSDNHSQKG